MISVISEYKNQKEIFFVNLDESIDLTESIVIQASLLHPKKGMNASMAKIFNETNIINSFRFAAYLP